MPEQISWVDVDGNEYLLTNIPSIGPLAGRRGVYMPPISFQEEEVPLQPGARLRRVRVSTREIDLPLRIEAVSDSEFRSTLRAWLHRFNPARGDGKLRIVAPDGSERELICRYADGLMGEERSEIAGPYWQEMVLVFRAVDPYWYARNAVVATFVAGAVAGWFPLFPLRLASSSIFTDTAVDNIGDVEAWPEWQITGPGSNLVLRNLSTGKLLSLTVALAAGETVNIDTRPGRKTVKRGNGANLFGSLSATSSLWPLQRGVNSVRIELSGSTVASSVQLSYIPRYLGA